MVDEKISVIMAIYNCAPYLPDAIESILNQTYTNWELILCDDASIDDTYAIAKQYADQHPDKIILIRNEQNMKLPYSLNHCLQYATGKYIARMDGDDKCLPERFEKQIAYLRSHPECDLVGTAMQRFDTNGYGAINGKIADPDYYSLRTCVPFHHATIITYKYVYDQVGGYTDLPRTVRGQDYDLWFKFYHAGFNGHNLQEALYLVREDEGAIRRRTAKVRMNALKTTYVGYKLLNYPRWWLIRPTCVAIFKCLIPTGLFLKYRQHEAAKQKKASEFSDR